jgi:hypothetical protein
MHISFKIIKFISLYAVRHVSDTIVSIIRNLLLLHMQSLVTVWCWVGCFLQPCSVVTAAFAAGGNNRPNTTRWPETACAAIRSSWWWTQWCPKHVEQQKSEINFIIIKLMCWFLFNIITVFFLWKKDGSTDMCHLTVRTHSEKCIVRQFHHCANIRECTYTHLGSTASATTHLCYMV